MTKNLKLKRINKLLIIILSNLILFEIKKN